jgi:hypothetical protein
MSDQNEAMEKMLEKMAELKDNKMLAEAVDLLMVNTLRTGKRHR